MVDGAIGVERKKKAKSFRDPEVADQVLPAARSIPFHFHHTLSSFSLFSSLPLSLSNPELQLLHLILPLPHSFFPSNLFFFCVSFLNTVPFFIS